MFYYTSDGAKFQSKIAAFEHFEKVNATDLRFYYYDHAYEKVNWKQEPPEPLKFYYKEQAQRLRDTYDYLILCYSGGYDSSNILETFYFNGIKLDKIVIVGAFSQDTRSGVDENHNGELYHNAFPYVESLGLASITEKYDYSELFANESAFSIMQYGDDWVDYTGGWFSPHNWFWRDIEKYVVPKNIGSKKVGLIFGRDKPVLLNNKFCFMDRPITSYGFSTGTANTDRINFYWDPTYPNILVKQLHVIKRLNAIAKPEFNSTKGTQVYGKIDVNQVIYDLKRPLIFKSPKSKSSLFSARDRFLGSARECSLFKRYSAGLTRMQNRAGIANIVKHITSREYSII
jgi:hypothetical protein